jgi:hypothetical protein
MVKGYSISKLMLWWGKEQHGNTRGSIEIVEAAD